MNKERKIFVYADFDESQPVLIGQLFSNVSRGKEIFSFEYDSDWLKSNRGAVLLDPDLSLYAGRQYAPLDKTLFGVFMDSCPDRWGRTLMNRREAITARREERKPRALTESDYLLGVYDESRMGALRFSMTADGPFLSDDKELSAPPWTTLRTLETASLEFENDNTVNNSKWLKQLIAPGSSLGGARPKASVKAPDDSLWIAKFPSRHDEWDCGAWEMVTHDLAAECGLNVPEARVESFSGFGSTYLTKRFDRKGPVRVHYASAMALLGRTDGSGSDDASYLDIAAFIKASGSKPSEDLKELWKRIVFSMTVSNTDDHLRNHGFLLTNDGWRLSPLFDVNPTIYGNALSLNVSTTDNSIDYDLALSTSKYYGLDINEANKALDEISGTVSSRWKKIAASHGLSHGIIEQMAPAFKIIK